jgi:hypothetical protein
LKTVFMKRKADLEALESAAIITNTATATLVTNQLSQGVVRGFTLLQDEPESIGGTAKGPTPVDYFVQASRSAKTWCSPGTPRCATSISRN